ncbi:MAG: segregation/condensation protein A [Mollicutes bacterium PWAP]|nr:segregation/condensation protein A [Mollicutes bacterium PWAP]
MRTENNNIDNTQIENIKNKNNQIENIKNKNNQIENIKNKNNQIENIQIENYEGPLDLLLEYIKDKKIDIKNINVIELSDFYNLAINNFKNQNIDLASEYLLMWATLLQLKSKSIFFEEDEEFQEDKNELIIQLIEYQKYKSLKSNFRDREKKRKLSFTKKKSDISEFEKETSVKILNGKSDITKLIIAMRKVFEKKASATYREAKIETNIISTQEMRERIIKIMQAKKEFNFEDIFSVPTIEHFTATLIALLDMSRRKEIYIYQENQYEEIFLKKGVINE